jgi:hypothetical protein
MKINISLFTIKIIIQLRYNLLVNPQGTKTITNSSSGRLIYDYSYEKIDAIKWIYKYVIENSISSKKTNDLPITLGN